MIYLFLSKAFYDNQKLNAISAIDLLGKNKTNSLNDLNSKRLKNKNELQIIHEE